LYQTGIIYRGLVANIAFSNRSSVSFSGKQQRSCSKPSNTSQRTAKMVRQIIKQLPTWCANWVSFTQQLGSKYFSMGDLRFGVCVGEQRLPFSLIL